MDYVYNVYMYKCIIYIYNFLLNHLRVADINVTLSQILQHITLKEQKCFPT